MSTVTRLAFIAGLGAVALFAQPATPGKTHLKVGDTAPDSLCRAAPANPFRCLISGAKRLSLLPFSLQLSQVVEPRS